MGNGHWVGKQLPVPPAQVLDKWIVYDVAPLDGNVVAIWASPDGKPQTR